jgi:putative MATE family efflux protein
MGETQNDGYALNPLGTVPIFRLLPRYAIPSIIAMLVMSLYNIVDQIFIGRFIGYLGNGATTVAFPLVTIMLSLAMLVGDGAAALVSLELGRGRADTPKRIMGNALTIITGISALLIIGFNLFLEPALRLLGAGENVMPYAVEYVSIIIWGAPFAMIGTGLANMIRADGSPRFSMIATMSGAVINTILDPVLMWFFDMGVRGAAIATVFSQGVVTSIVLYYFLHRAKHVRLSANNLRPKPALIGRIAALGSSSFVIQMSIALLAIVLNNSVTYYGARTVYGSDIPLAALGIVVKINSILVSIILGIVVGAQPILGFNYGAKNFKRVRHTYFLEIGAGFTVSFIGWLLFITVPDSIISIFGGSSAEFNEFTARFLRVFLFGLFAIGVQIPSAGYFQAVGKPLVAMGLSMTRQLILLIPLILVLPLFMGLDGVLCAGPIADFTSFLITLFFIAREMRRLNKDISACALPVALKG